MTVTWTEPLVAPTNVSNSFASVSYPFYNATFVTYTARETSYFAQQSLNTANYNTFNLVFSCSAPTTINVTASYFATNLTYVGSTSVTYFVKQKLAINTTASQVYKNIADAYISPAPTYYLRGWDTAAANFVYWQSTGTPNSSPTSTNPALTGTLTNVCIVGSI